MTAPDTLPAPDRRRAAELMLACLDDDGADTVTAVLDEAYESPGGLQSLIAPLALATLEVLIQKIRDDDRTRELLTGYLDHAPDAGHRRAATMLLAGMDDDGADTFNAALAEAYAAPGGLPGLLAALAETAATVLVVAIGVADARSTLNLQILNAEVDSDD